MEHGVLHTGKHDVDPQDMFNMGGLRNKMPKTFWTFLIGGFALSGFPLVTAGFWSKDEILADAWAHQHEIVFWTLAIAALLTAFYTMRQITLTFLGQPRTKEAEHAQETANTMTVPLIILAVFAVAIGWIGIPEDFPVLGGIIPNWLHGFLGGTLIQHLETIKFDPFPLIVSIVVALGGLSLGWLVYRNIEQGAPDPLRKPLGPLYSLFENKYNIDEIYQILFVRPSMWFSEKFTYLFLDRTVIDGILHLAARSSFWLGGFFRTRIDIPIVNRFGDFVGFSTNDFGHWFRKIQTGRVQQYMLVSGLVAFIGLFFYIYYLQL